MKKFTKLFGLMLLMVLFSVLGRAQTIVPPSDCGATISASNVELVTPLEDVCDSSNVTFKVVGDFADTTLYAFNFDNIDGGGFALDSTVTVKEGETVWIQVMEISGGDTCYSNAIEFATDVVEPIKILDPETEHPTCGETKGEVSVQFEGGYLSKYLTGSGIQYPYQYSVVPSADWHGADYYPAATSTSSNWAKGPGTYYVAVFENKDTSLLCLTDITNITAWDTAIVKETSPAVVLDTIYSTNPVCYGGTGTVTVEVSAGTPASYGLIVDLVNDATDVVVATDTTDAVAVFTEIPVGTYYAMVTDSIGCEDESDTTVTITSPAEVKFDIDIKSVDCFGGNEGAITILMDTAMSVDTVTYQALLVSLDPTVDDSVYTWTDIVNDTLTIDSLYAIYYAVYVKDATNGCDSVPYKNPNDAGNYISLQSPGEITFDLVFENGVDSVPCYGDSIWVSVENIVGGSGSYAVQLGYFGGDTITGYATDAEKWLLPALPLSAKYQVFVKDSLVELTCGTDSIFHIASNGPVNVIGVETTNPICFGGSDGTIEITAVGGSGTYQYSLDSINWYNYNVFNGPAGEYTVYARDKYCPNNVDYDEDVWIEEDPNIIYVDNYNYYEDYVCPDDATGEYECEWYGYYTDTMICSGSTTGQIVVGVDSWNRGSSGLEIRRRTKGYISTSLDSVYVSGTEMKKLFTGHGDFVFVADELPADTYYIWAVDTFGCVLTDMDDDGEADYLTVTVDEYDPLQLFVDVVDSASCSGTNDGLIVLTKAGGDTLGYDGYRGYPVAVTKSAEATSVSMSNYLYGIADTYQQALLKQPSSMLSWPEDQDEVYMQVTGGLHYLVLYDATCEDRVIVEVDVFGYDAVEIGTKDSVTNIVCIGGATGEIFMNPATGGSGDLVYTLYEGGTSAADTVEGYVGVTDTAFTGLVAGMYYVEVTDLGPSACEGEIAGPIEVSEPDIDFWIETQDISCYGAADALLKVYMSGVDSTSAPYFKLGASTWKPFDTYVNEEGGYWTKNVNIVEEGDYVVYGVDSVGLAAGCTGKQEAFTIVEPPVLTVTAVGLDSTDCSTKDDGFITVSIEGGKVIVDSFLVQLTGIDTALIARDSVLVFDALPVGTYELVVTEIDSAVTNPCIWTDSIEVMDNGIIASVKEYTEMLACKGDSTGTIVLDIEGGSDVYLITINQDTVVLDTNNAITDLPAGEYVIFIQDSVTTAGNDTVCTYTLDTVVIAEPLEYLTLDATKIQDMSCSEGGKFSLQAAGGTGDYEYYAAISTFPAHMLLPDPDDDAWVSDSIFTVDQAGTWVVWVKDAAGCIVGGEFDDNDKEINKWRVPILAPKVQITVAPTVVDPILCNADVATIVVDADSVVITKEGDATYDPGYIVWFENLAGDVLSETDTVYATDTVIAWVLDTVSGCTGFDTVAISVPDALEAVSLIKGEGEFTCPNVTEGYVEVYAAGGTEPYTYQLLQEGTAKGPYRVDYSFLVDAGYEYSFVVKDANGCTDTLDYGVEISTAEPITFEVEDVTCSSDTAASVLVTVTGEAGHKFKIEWRQYEVETIAAEGTHSGATGYYYVGESVKLDQIFRFDNESDFDQHYEITVTDSAGCDPVMDSMTFDQIITSPLVLAVTIGAEGECTTEVSMVGSGGVAPYKYYLNGELAETTVNLGGGDNLLTVEDAHGCTVDSTISIAYSTEIAATLYAGIDGTAYYDVLDTTLIEGSHVIIDSVDGCPAEYSIEVLAGEVPVLDSVSPMDTITDNKPDFVITFLGDVTYGAAGTLTVTALGDTEPTLVLDITEDMFSGNTVTVTYDWEVDGRLDTLTSYIVQVDSGVVMGNGLAWEGIADSSWTFTTGPDVATDNDEIGLDKVDFQVYPNPFVDYIKIKNYDKLTRVVMTNIAGQRVLDIEYPTEEIRTGNLVTGVYVVSMFTEDGRIESARIIKR